MNTKEALQIVKDDTQFMCDNFGELLDYYNPIVYEAIDELCS